MAELWIVTVLPARTTPWLAGAALVVLGVGGLAAGIRSEVDY